MATRSNSKAHSPNTADTTGHPVVSAAYHWMLPTKPDSPLLYQMQGLAQEAGLSPVFSKAQEHVSTELGPWMIDLPDRWAGQREVFTDHENGHAVLFRTQSMEYVSSRKARALRQGQLLEALFLSRESGCDWPDQMRSMITERLSIDAAAGTLGEAATIEELGRKLKDQSQNGKLLGDPELREACRIIESDKIRSQVLAVANAFPESSVPRSTLAMLDAFTSSASDLDALLRDARIMDRQFAVVCEQCGTTLIAFADERRAIEIAGDAESRCPSCIRSQLKVEELFSANQRAIRGLRQGIWLESMVCDVVRTFTENVWFGQMVDSDEIDVLAVAFDQIILIECKDTSFGRNDLYVTSAKAQNVDATSVMVVTTRDVHPNVQEAVKSLEQKRGVAYRGIPERNFTILSNPSASELKLQLSRSLEKNRKTHLRNWLKPDRYEYMDWL